MGGFDKNWSCILASTFIIFLFLIGFPFLDKFLLFIPYFSVNLQHSPSHFHLYIISASTFNKNGVWISNILLCVVVSFLFTFYNSYFIEYCYVVRINFCPHHVPLLFPPHLLHIFLLFISFYLSLSKRNVHKHGDRILNTFKLWHCQLYWTFLLDCDRGAGPPVV